MPEAAADEAGQEQQQEVDDRTELQLVQAEPISERIAAMLAADGSRGDDMKELKTAADNTKARSKDECLSETVNKLKAKPWQFGYAAALEYMQYVLVLLMIIDDMKKHSQTQNLENWGAKTPTSLLNRMREQYGGEDATMPLAQATEQECVLPPTVFMHRHVTACSLAVGCTVCMAPAALAACNHSRAQIHALCLL